MRNIFLIVPALLVFGCGLKGNRLAEGSYHRNIFGNESTCVLINLGGDTVQFSVSARAASHSGEISGVAKEAGDGFLCRSNLGNVAYEIGFAPSGDGLLISESNTSLFGGAGVSFAGTYSKTQKPRAELALESLKRKFTPSEVERLGRFKGLDLVHLARCMQNPTKVDDPKFPDLKMVSGCIPGDCPLARAFVVFGKSGEATVVTMKESARVYSTLDLKSALPPWINQWIVDSVKLRGGGNMDIEVN